MGSGSGWAAAIVMESRIDMGSGLGRDECGEEHWWEEKFALRGHIYEPGEPKKLLRGRDKNPHRVNLNRSGLKELKMSKTNPPVSAFRSPSCDIRHL